MDTYLTLQSSSETQLTEKRSRFLAFAMHVDSEQEAKEMVALYKKNIMTLAMFVMPMWWVTKVR